MDNVFKAIITAGVTNLVTNNLILVANDTVSTTISIASSAFSSTDSLYSETIFVA